MNKLDRILTDMDVAFIKMLKWLLIGLGVAVATHQIDLALSSYFIKLIWGGH